jgi:hypothetical protein
MLELRSLELPSLELPSLELPSLELGLEEKTNHSLSFQKKLRTSRIANV